MGGGAASLCFGSPLAATRRPAGSKGSILGQLFLPDVLTWAFICLDSLLERKELWRRQMEEQLRSLPDPDTPPGHTMMPEGQRLETLSNLKQSKRKRSGDSSSGK